VLDDRLGLTPEQSEAIRPEVERLRDALATVIDVWIEQGFFDPGGIPRQLAPVMADLKQRAESLLEREQYEKMDTLLATLQDNGTEIIRFIILQQLASRLGMTPGQIRDLRPVLHEYLVRLSSVLKEAAENEDWSLAYFMAVYDNYEGELRVRLEGQLDEAQIRELMLFLGEVRGRIQTALETYQ
jgi:hypothetical protein